VFLEVRILNELRGCFVDVRILQGLVNRGSWAVSRRRGEMAGDLMRCTRESLARKYQLAKYYLGDSKNWDVSGRWEL
jgi:hypothetical protein